MVRLLIFVLPGHLRARFLHARALACLCGPRDGSQIKTRQLPKQLTGLEMIFLKISPHCIIQIGNARDANAFQQNQHFLSNCLGKAFANPLAGCSMAN
jgi:hypothetical protein